jgi:hypothetical protein
MKTSIVPSQITTLEDKIIGNMGVTQVILLVIPLFLFGFCFVLTPPFFHFAVYKDVLSGSVAILSVCLSIRIRGQLIFNRIRTYGNYALRPRYYFYKVLEYSFDNSDPIEYVTENTEQNIKRIFARPPSVLEIIDSRSIDVTYSANRKGTLDVSVK